MGYAYRLYKMNRKDAQRISRMSYDELLQEYGEDDWFYIGHLPMKELHSNGELNADEVIRIHSKGQRFLSDASFDNSEEAEATLIENFAVHEWIKIYRERIVHFLEELVSEKPDESGQSPSDRQAKYVSSLLTKWQERPPYRIEKDCISASRDYEYIIFELVYQCNALKEDEIFVFCSH